MKTILLLSMLIVLNGCGNQASPSADVTAVSVNGNEFNYSFNVTLSSDETGCKQYADWWEVLDANGELLYRRILIHSHPDEQPFTRSGGSVNINSTQTVYVRAHMNPTGYKGNVLKGSLKNGFILTNDTIKNSKQVEVQEPQPNGCAF